MKFFEVVNFRSLSALCLCLLLGSSAWLLGGYTAFTLKAMLALSCGAFVFACFALVFSDAEKNGYMLNPFKWSAFWFGALFLLVVYLQTLNPAARYVQADAYSFLEPLKHIAYLPTCVEVSFDFGGAWRFFAQALMLFLFGAACYAIFKKRAFAVSAICAFALSATAMAAFAIVQQKLGAPAIYWKYEAVGSFFGTFHLMNVSASYFNAAIACCLCMVFMRRMSLYIGSVWAVLVRCAFLVCALINACAVYCSTSKGGLGAMLVVFSCAFLTMIFKFFYERFSLRVSLGFVVVCCVLAVSAATMIIVSPAGEISEAEAKFLRKDAVGSVLSRVAINKTAIEVFAEHPLWGVGADAYGFYAVPKMLASQDSLVKSPSAAFKAHCDIIGYLVEFGVAGLGIIACVFLCFFKRAWNLRGNFTDVNLIAAAGALGIVVHGLVDMPLRVPSTMLAFVFLIMISITPFRHRAELDS